MKGPPFPLAAGGQRHTLPPCEKEGGAQPGSRGDSQKLRFWCPSRYALRLPLTSTLGMSTAMSLSMERTLKSLAEYAGGVSAFFGAICLLIGWIRLKDARDFLFDLLLKGEISSDWVAAAFLVAGLVLLALAGWSGVLTPPSASRSQDQ